MEEEIKNYIIDFLTERGVNIPGLFVWISLLVFMAILTWLSKRIGDKFLKYIKIQSSAKDLHPYYSKADVKNYTRYYVPTKIRDKPPSNYDDFLDARTIDIDTDGIKWFMERAFDDKDDARFYLVLADAGMGKTAFLINLYLAYSRKFFKKYDIKLFPIGHENTFLVLEKIKQTGKDKDTILLLDGFDEDSQALENWQKRFYDIINFVQTFREVVITSRTQFFPNEMEEPSQTKIPNYGSEKGMLSINKMYISPFFNSDIELYLRKKFNFLNPFIVKKRARAKKIVLQSPSLMLRPMLLAYIDDLLDSTSKFMYTFQIYEELILKWISREADRIVSSDREDFIENLSQFSRITAITIYKNWIAGRQGFRLTSSEIDEIAVQNNINLRSLEMKSRSLLNRNVRGEYKFSHRTILEFFLAKECIIDDNFGATFNYSGFDQAKKFVAELSRVKYVIKFLKENRIKYYTRYYDMVIGKRKVKQFLKTMVVNRNQLDLLLINLDDNRFVEGFNDLLFQNVVILQDSRNYKIENLQKITTLKRITTYTNLRRVKDGKLINLRKLLPNCYIPNQS